MKSSQRLNFIKELQKREPKSPSIEIGEDCEISATAVLGGDGFGYEPDENGELIFFPHFGGVRIGDRVRIGRYTCIDRGNLKDTIIGNGTKIDNLVHIAHNVNIGRNCVIVAGSVVCGSVVIGDSCFIGANATIKEHLKIGDNVIIGMGSVVLKDIPSNETWAGNPAKKIK